MVKYRSKNDNYQYILVVVDILSHYAWTRALKFKTSTETAKAFRSILSEGRTPHLIRSDKGKEFKNASVQRLFRENNIHYFNTENELHANYVERLNRTLKLRMSRYFTGKNTFRWIDILTDVTYSYNHTFHRTIKRTPASVTKDNEDEVWHIQYGSSRAKSEGPYTFEVGDYVRISHLRKAFQREYDERYTGEIFKVTSRRVRDRLNIYYLKDLADESLTGSYYQLELQKITTDINGVFKIEKVLKSRKRRGCEKEYLVQWLHYPKKFNSWVIASELADI